jgi:hypothetical protein
VEGGKTHVKSVKWEMILLKTERNKQNMVEREESRFNGRNVSKFVQVNLLKQEYGEDNMRNSILLRIVNNNFKIMLLIGLFILYELAMD